MPKLSDLTNAATKTMLGNASLTKGVLAVGTAPAGFNTTATILYTVNGVMYNKTAMTSQSFAVTHTLDGTYTGGGYIQPDPATLALIAGAAQTTCTVYYTLALKADGTVAVSQGSYAGQNMAQGQVGVSAVGDGTIPNAPAGYTPFGIIKVVTATGASFTPGTTALTGLATYFDIAVMPEGKL